MNQKNIYSTASSDKVGNGKELVNISDETFINGHGLSKKKNKNKNTLLDWRIYSTK